MNYLPQLHDPSGGHYPFMSHPAFRGNDTTTTHYTMAAAESMTGGGGGSIGMKAGRMHNTGRWYPNNGGNEQWYTSSSMMAMWIAPPYNEYSQAAPPPAYNHSVNQQPLYYGGIMPEVSPYPAESFIPTPSLVENEEPTKAYYEEEVSGLGYKDVSVGVEEQDKDDDTSNARVYVKSKAPLPQKLLDQRNRKNKKAKARLAKILERIAAIQSTPESDRTKEDADFLRLKVEQRTRKNIRARVRGLEKKAEVERILRKPEGKRSKTEKDYVNTILSAREHKKQGDRLRRKRVKEMKRAAHSKAHPFGDIFD